jgi:hypothetical protein
MKSEEFKNVKNGYFIHVVAKLWLEPHDPEQKCRNTFDRIFSELKKDAASGVTLGKFTLASIESDEEQNENAIMTNTSREYPGLYTMRFSFIYIFKYNFPNCIDQLSLDFFRSASGFLYNWCHIRLR